MQNLFIAELETAGAELLRFPASHFVSTQYALEVYAKRRGLEIKPNFLIWAPEYALAFVDFPNGITGAVLVIRTLDIVIICRLKKMRYIGNTPAAPSLVGLRGYYQHKSHKKDGL
ncbi:MAG: hypothetical protein UX43_C0019G0011, partial [Candidatus Giovannonibacteria bacterium GW2011_GWB1_46_20]